MTELKIVLFLLTLGAAPQNHQQTLEELNVLVQEKVDDIHYGDDGVYCNSETKVVDYLVSDSKKLIVDFEVMQDERIHGCSARPWFCRAIFNEKEVLEKYNCRD